GAATECPKAVPAPRPIMAVIDILVLVACQAGPTHIGFDAQHPIWRILPVVAGRTPKHHAIWVVACPPVRVVCVRSNEITRITGTVSDSPAAVEPSPVHRRCCDRCVHQAPNIRGIRRSKRTKTHTQSSQDGSQPHFVLQ